MDKIVIVRSYLLARKRQAFRRMNWGIKQSMRRRRAFARRQSQERLMFMLMLAVVSSSLRWPPVRTLWAKERSNHWWEHVVNSTFTLRDWQENFRMSHDTFLYLRDKLQTTIVCPMTLSCISVTNFEPPSQKLILSRQRQYQQNSE